MPTYDLKCECGETREVLCSYSDRENQNKTCEKCGKTMDYIIGKPQMIIIEDVCGKAGLYHKKVFTGKGSYNTTDGYGSRYYWKNNPHDTDNPQLIKRKMESDSKSK